MEFNCSDPDRWKLELSSYSDRIKSLNKLDLVPLDEFYTNKLPSLIKSRNPNPHITVSELGELMKWKLSRGKWRPRLLDFVTSLDDQVVKLASEKAFEALPDVEKAVKELTVLKGVGAATASAVLATCAPEVAPFMSDEAMVAALGSAKDYSLKQYVRFASKLQEKAKGPLCLSDVFWPGAWLSFDKLHPEFVSKMRQNLKELSSNELTFTPSDIERALWSAAIGSTLSSSPPNPDLTSKSTRLSKRKRK